MNQRAVDIIKPLLIMAIIAMITWIILQPIKNKILEMALLRKLVPFMQKWEGGLSRDPKDRAKYHPAPWKHKGVTGWHTNKGVTYASFKHLAPQLGYKVNSKNFFEMPDDLWLGILKKGYMSFIPLDRINHLPRIQAVIITWAWGSGPGGAERRLANFIRDEFKVKDSDITPTEIIDHFNRVITPANEKRWFLKLCDRREADFRKMPTASTHLKGWLNRLNEFRTLFN